jgi:hypothetical protein
MNPIKLAALTVLVPCVASQAANIAWISFHGADNTPTVNAANAGHTVAPDSGYTSLLTGAGHSVTRFVTGDNADTLPAFATLNTFDLVIIGRSVNSAHYQQANEATFWNTTVTAPLMDMSGYTLRNSRLGYTTGGNMPDITAPVKLTVSDVNHPIFAGISLDVGNTMVNDYAEIITFNSILQRGISVNTDPLAGGGTLLAAVSAGAPSAANGAMIAEWNAGATMATTPATTLGGHRLVFLSGSREADGISGETAGLIDLTADGRTMFLNAVTYMTTPVPEPASLSLIGLGAAALLLRKRRA